MVENLNELARNIIVENQYCILATSDELGNPWISPVAYVFDQQWNLYFVSMPSSKHGQNIKKNGKVAVSIFDSTQNWGDGVGLQIESTIEIVKGVDVLKIAKLYASREYPYGGIKMEQAMDFVKSMVLEGKQYKIYKIMPKTVWMNNPNASTDVRIKVELAQP